MGFVDSDSDSEAEDEVLRIHTDEEVNLGNSKGSSPFHDYRTFSTCDPRPPTAKVNDLLNITRLRRNSITESEEIWEDLEDDTVAELSSFSRRRSSGRSNPSLNLHARGVSSDESTNAETDLRIKSSTGRSYRDRRKRRSTPLLNIQEMERRGTFASSEELSSTWWKIKNWWRGSESKDKGKGAGNVNGNRS